jgi:uncharacterized protein YjiS (DUF1127 family)
MLQCTTDEADPCTAVRARQEKRTSLMFVSALLSKIRSYLRYRETLSELSRLSDRDLADLGFSRFDIDAVARGHFNA